MDNYYQRDDYLIVKVDNQTNIKIINVNQCNQYYTNCLDNGKSLSSSLLSSLPPSSQETTTNFSKENELINLIRHHLKFWIDSLGIQSAEAQNLKEPITCHTRFIQGSFRSNSPLKHNDSIYFLVQTINSQPSLITKGDDHNNQQSGELNGIQLLAVGFIRIGYRNLFLQHSEQLVNVNRCFSILDFYVTRQRQGLGKLLISSVLTDHTININKCAFDRPTSAMLSFLGKHFNLGSPRKQHNRFVIYDGFFT